MATITINGNEHEVAEDATILEAAREHGYDIPTLCHHPHLSNVGACRMCLVEDENSGELFPSCTTPVRDGMNISADEEENERLFQSRRLVVKLLLSDHPNDCMTCEADGSCKLQDLAYHYDVEMEDESLGIPKETPRFEIESDNPFIEHDPDKCILCGRCVRVDNEVQCSDAIEFVERGFSARVGSALKKDLGSDESSCVFCGQCVQQCPTGALQFKPSQGKGREYQLEHTETTCGYCGVGCQLDLKTLDNEVVEVEGVSREGLPNPLGETCVKGRFGYDFLDDPDRLTKPLIKDEETGEFEEVSWQEALEYTADNFSRIKEEHGPQALAGLTSARCSNEENFLMQKFMRAVLGTHTVDHCARL